MSQFGLLEKVNQITNPSYRTPSYATPSYVNTDTCCAETPARDYEENKARIERNIKNSHKSLNNFHTLSYGDVIIDDEGNRRYVVTVVENKLMLTGRKSNLNNYKKVFTWTPPKVQDKMANNGWRLA